jgi:hypothetical protein
VQDPATGFTPLHAAIAACDPANQNQEQGQRAEGQGENDEPEAPVDMEKAKETLEQLFLAGAIWNDLDANDEAPGCLAWRLGLRELYKMVVEAGVYLPQRRWNQQLLVSLSEHYWHNVVSMSYSRITISPFVMVFTLSRAPVRLPNGFPQAQPPILGVNVDLALLPPWGGWWRSMGKGAPLAERLIPTILKHRT